MEKAKIVAIVIIALMAISAFAVLTPKVAATGEWQVGNCYIDDSGFLRCYSYNYESTHNGHPSNAVYDEAYITGDLPSGSLGSDQRVEARLLKVVTVDGNVVANGLFVDGILIGPTSGVTWVQTQDFDYYDWIGAQVYFTYDLSWNSVFYGYNQWPNYWTGDSFADMLGGWAGHTISVSFAIEWYQQNWWGGWDQIGATCNIPDVYNPGPLSTATTHSEQGWETWKWMIPDGDIHFACSGPSQYTYLNAQVINPYNVQGRTPDGNYANLNTWQSSAMAQSTYWVGGTTSGTIYIYGDSTNSPFSRFLVYVSSDDYNWRLSSEQLVYNSGNRWIDCGTPSGTYQYVLLCTYDSGSYSCMQIDCINIGGHF